MKLNISSCAYWLQRLHGSPKLRNQFTKTASRKSLRYENYWKTKQTKLKLTVHLTCTPVSICSCQHLLFSVSAPLGSAQLCRSGSSSGTPCLPSVVLGVSRTSLWIGRSREDTGLVLLPLLDRCRSPTARFTLRNSPSFSFWASVTRACCHWLRGVLSSLMITTSPTCKFRLRRTHFCRFCKAWRNSFFHWTQSSFVECWTRRHCFLE